MDNYIDVEKRASGTLVVYKEFKLKSTLLNLLQKCFDDSEMSIMSSLRGYKWEPPDSLIRETKNDVIETTVNAEIGGWYPKIIDILKHVVECDEMYMEQAFNYTKSNSANDFSSLKNRLKEVHSFWLHMIDELSKEDLRNPAKTNFHGESAVNLFTVLARHHVNHGAQIKVLRKYLKYKNSLQRA